MHKFWFHFVEPKYDEKAKLCYIDTDSLIVSIKTNGIYQRYCLRFWKKVWHFKLWVRKITNER